MKKTICCLLTLIFVFCISASSYASDEPETQAAATDTEPMAQENDNDDALLTVNTNLQFNVSAKACVLMDANTGTLLLALNENEQLYPASVTKIMTLLLVCEAIKEGKLTFDTVLTCSDTASSKGGSQIWLEPGETMTVDELLKAAAVYSANDACTLLGEAVAGSEEAFVEKMNSKAAELGMTGTHFDNCTGLDDETDTHKTTAYDIALMSRELLKYDFIKNYTTIWMDSLRGGTTQLVNTNRLIRFYSGCNGLKTGTTSKAGCCISASAERDSLELVAVVLGADNSDDRFNGAKALLNYGFANYEIYSPVVDETELPPVRVLHGTNKTVNAVYSDSEDIFLSKDVSNNITRTVTLCEEIEAPVEKGQEIGKVTFSAGDITVAEFSLRAGASVEKMTFSKALYYMIKTLSDL